MVNDFFQGYYCLFYFTPFKMYSLQLQSLRLEACQLYSSSPSFENQ